MCVHIEYGYLCAWCMWAGVKMKKHKRERRREGGRREGGR